MIGIAIVLATTVAAASPEPQAQPQPGSAQSPSQVVQSSAGDDSQKMVCKREPVTGSRFMKKVCMTKAEWDERERNAEKFMREANQRGGISPPSSASPF